MRAGLVTLVLALTLVSGAVTALGQSIVETPPTGNVAAPLIKQPLDESQLVVLKGNAHPMAQAAFDRGPAPLDLPLKRMLLVLRREDTAVLGSDVQNISDSVTGNGHF